MKKLIIGFLGVLLLLPYSVSAADLRYGMKNNDEVRSIQQFLKDNNYYTGDVTGNFYSFTLAAVKKFQKSNSLKMTGIWNQESQNKMNEILALNTDNSPNTVVDNSPTIQVGWISNGDGTFSPPPQTIQPIITPQPTVINTPNPYLPPIQPNQPSNPPSNSPTTPLMDTTPPKVIVSGWSRVQVTPDRERTSLGSNPVYWPSNVTFGNMQNECSGCFFMKTDEPTTLKIEYIEFNDSEPFDSTKEYSDRLKTLNDSLNTFHLIPLKTFAKSWPSRVIFRYSIKDAAGNEYKQAFTGSDGVTVPWGSTMSYDSNLDVIYSIIDNVRTNY